MIWLAIVPFILLVCVALVVRNMSQSEIRKHRKPLSAFERKILREIDYAVKREKL